MESEYEDATRSFIKITAMIILVLGIVLILWFLGDWIMISVGGKPYYEMFDFPSVLRLLSGFLFVIVFVFSKMLRKNTLKK
jgi:hypothetical protein